LVIVQPPKKIHLLINLKFNTNLTDENFKMSKYKIYVSDYNFADEVRKEQNIQSMNNVKICDTTLRDGEQTAGVIFSSDEKLEIAKYLAELGVEQIEAGIPVVSQNDVDAIKLIVKEKEERNLKVSIMGWSRANKKDIDKVVETGCDAIAISLATSNIHLEHKLHRTKEEILNMAAEAVSYAHSHGLYISFNAEDGSRTDYDLLIEYIKTCKNAGGKRLRLCDTVSALNPTSAKFLVKKIKQTVDIPIEIHAHNDYGLAVANSLAAIEAGAEYVSTTVNGIGERSGNASLEQIIMSLICLYKTDSKYKTENLKKISEYVENASNIKVSQMLPVVGENAFRHESGIHVDGLLKFPFTYQTYSPQMVGQKMKLIIGKMSGKSAIKGKLDEYKIKASETDMDEILKQVKIAAERRKSALLDEEFIEIVHNVMKKEAFILVEVLPKERPKVYDEIGKISDIEVYEVAGNVDIILKTTQKSAESIIEKINEIEGVTKTATYAVIKRI